MKRLLLGLFALLTVAGAPLAHAATVTVKAQDIHLCVNVHDQDASGVVAGMKAAGFTCYRKDATGAPLETDLAKAGYAGDFIVTDGPSPTGQMAEVAALAKAVPGSVQSVEGRNEINNRATVYGGFTDTGGFDQSNRSAIHEYMRDLVGTVHTMLPGVPVLAHTDIHSTWAPADYANAHAYDGDTDSFPDYWPYTVAGEMKAAMPGAPQALTEFGSKTTGRQARLLPQWIADALLNGIDRMWLYELRDESGDPYGLFDANWNDRGAVAPIASLNALFADTGPAFTPAPLNVTTSDDGVNSVLIAKSDGSYVHLIWRSWPDGAQHPIRWTYDRPMQVIAHGADGGVFYFPWTKPAGQPNDWQTYVEGVIVLELRPA